MKTDPHFTILQIILAALLGGLTSRLMRHKKIPFMDTQSKIVNFLYELVRYVWIAAITIYIFVPDLIKGIKGVIDTFIDSLDPFKLAIIIAIIAEPFLEWIIRIIFQTIKGNVEVDKEPESEDKDENPRLTE